MNRERLHVITNPKKLFAPMRGIIVEAHPDDAAMSQVDNVLAQKGVGLTVVTFTDGAARNLANFTPETLRLQRRQESPKSVKIMGGAQVFNADLPDGELADYQEEAKDFLAEIVKSTQPDFLIVPNPGDPHSDHRAASEVSKVVAEEEIPIYFTDTITKYSIDDFVPTHYVELSGRAVNRRSRAYKAHESQVKNLPPHEMLEVNAVLTMPQREGKKIGKKYAGALLLHNSSKGDPIAEILKKMCIWHTKLKSKAPV